MIRKKIIHIISGLEVGGAEMMLYKIISSNKNSEIKNKVISLGGVDKIGNMLKNIGIEVYGINFSKKILSLKNIINFIKFIFLIKKLKPDIVLSWMYHANIVGLLLKFLMSRNTVLIWNIRHTLYDIKYEKPLTRIVIFLNKLFSFIPNAIIFNSFESLNQHKNYGFKNNKMIVIPNGYDTTIFKPDKKAYGEVRSKYGIQPNSTVIGLVARYHPMKDHHNFLKAFKIIISKQNNVFALLIGRGVDYKNKKLIGSIEKLKVDSNVFLLGEKKEIAYLTASFDIAVSTSSYGESFSNAIGEAMACGIPCVVTDVGDSKRIVGDAGIVVPPSDPAALAVGIEKLIELGKDGRKKLGEKARKRIIDNYSIEKIVNEYINMYDAILNKRDI